MKKEKKDDFEGLGLEDEFMDQFVRDVMSFEQLLQNCTSSISIIRDAMIAQELCIMMYQRDIKLLKSHSPEISESYKDVDVSSEMLHEAYLNATSKLMDYMDIRRMGKH